MPKSCGDGTCHGRSLHTGVAELIVENPIHTKVITFVMIQLAVSGDQGHSRQDRAVAVCTANRAILMVVVEMAVQQVSISIYEISWRSGESVCGINY